MTEINVVFPQPLGPTRNVSLPRNASKFTPRRTSMRIAPSPKSFRRSRHWTAGVMVALMKLSSKDNRWFEHQHAAQAEDTRQNHDQNDAPARECDTLPHEDNAAGGHKLEREFKKSCGHSGANRKADDAHREGLEQNHADEPPIRDADGFDGAELLQIFDREKIKRLSCDHDADHQRDIGRASCRERA